MDRRKVIHQICANVMAVEDAVATCINVQAAAGSTAAFPAAAADVSSIQTTIPALNNDLDVWYTAWRGSDPVENPDPSFLGVFGGLTSFKNELKALAPIELMVRNDYTVLSMLAMAYEQLYTIALALDADAPGLKTIALDGLKDITPMIYSVSETMCTVTVRDLHNQDSTIPMSLAATAVTDTQSAW